MNGVAHLQHPVPVPDVCGPSWWAILHAVARAITEAGCRGCGEEAESLVRLDHDIINVKLGRPPLYPAEALRWLPLVQEIAGGQVEASASPLPVCSTGAQRKLERCIAEVKETGNARSPWAVCQVSVGCRPGGAALG